MSDSGQKARITSITIENFKGIGAPVTIPIKPITLLFGKNSVGKSTVIEALLLMQDLMRARDPDLDTLTYGGDVVHLGGFQQFVHKHDPKKKVRIRVTFSLGKEGLPRYTDLMRACEEWCYEEDVINEELDLVDVNKLIDIESCFSEIVVGVNEVGKVEVLKYTSGINEKSVITLSDFKCRFNTCHPAVKEFLSVKFSNSVWDRKTKTFQKKTGVNETHQKTIRLQGSPDGLKIKEVADIKKSTYYCRPCRIPLSWDLGMVVELPGKRTILREYGLRESDVTCDKLKLLYHFLTQMGSGIGGTLKSILDDHIFIGPLRKVPQKIHCRSHPRYDTEDREHAAKNLFFFGWADGCSAWDRLGRPQFLISTQQRKRLDTIDRKIERLKHHEYEMDSLLYYLFDLPAPPKIANRCKLFYDELREKNPVLPSPTAWIECVDISERCALWEGVKEQVGLSMEDKKMFKEIVQCYHENRRDTYLLKQRSYLLKQRADRIKNRIEGYQYEQKSLKLEFEREWEREGTVSERHYWHVHRVNSLLNGINFRYCLKVVDQAVVFIDTKSNTQLRPADLGIGVSQLMPIIIGASYNKSVFSVQQPELHLHPALQCEVADILLFSRSLVDDEGFNTLKFSPLLIETHSEHLILRFLRRIRETSKGVLESSEKQHLKLTPEEMSVLYISEASNGLRVTPIGVDENGQFIDEWPEGFFEEGYGETVGGL